MNAKRLFTVLFSLMLVFAITPEVAAQKALLRLNLDQDQTYSYVSTTDQVITQDIMGMNQVIKQKIMLYYDVTVKEVSDETYTLDYTYTRAALNMDGGPMLGVTEYDSEDADENVPPMAMGYSGLVGQTFTTIVNYQGEILEVQGVDAMLDNMVEGMDGIPASERETMKTSLRSQFGEDAMKSNLQGASPILPEKKVKAGKGWDYTSTITAGFTMDQTSEYTVKSVSSDEVVLTSTFSQVSDPESPMETNGMTMNYEVTGSGTGESVIDRASGMISSSTATQEMSGEVTASGGMMGAGMTWPITITSTSVLEMDK